MYFGDKVFKIVILCNVCLVEVLLYGMLGVVFDVVLKGVKVYLDFGVEMIVCVW